MTTIVLALIAVAAVILLERLFHRMFPNLVARLFGPAIGRMVLASQPDHLHLDPVSADSWADFEAASDLGRPFLLQGFESAGTFRIEEMPGVIVQLLAHPAQGLYAAIYEHPQAGHWIDIVARYADGTGATFTTAKPSGLDPLPGRIMVNAPGLTPRALLDRMLFERPAGALLPATAATAAQVFMDAYAEETAWRKNRGLTAAEVGRVARQAA